MKRPDIVQDEIRDRVRAGQTDIYWSPEDFQSVCALWYVLCDYKLPEKDGFLMYGARHYVSQPLFDVPSNVRPAENQET